ncbi:MAG: hypothetical protein AB1640_17105 [bacterium]
MFRTRKTVAAIFAMALIGSLIAVSDAKAEGSGEVGRPLVLASGCCSGSHEQGVNHPATAHQGMNHQPQAGQHAATQPQQPMTHLAGATEAPAAASGRQELCPILGAPVDRSVFADHDGKRVYFCCAGCIPAFKENPEKYIKEMQAKGITLESAPAR